MGSLMSYTSEINDSNSENERQESFKRVCHDVHIHVEEDHTIFSYHHEWKNIKYHQKHKVKKRFSVDEVLDIIQKIQDEWATDLVNGVSLESLLMEEAL